MYAHYGMGQQHTMAQAQMMGAQLGGVFGGMGNGMVMNGAFSFSGSAMNLEARLGSVTPEEAQSLQSASITVTGQQVKEPNTLCMICTIIWGSILIIPIFFMCCSWWQKIVNPAYEVPMSTYQSIGNLMQQSGMASVTLNVLDSTLDQQKAQFLYDIISRSQLKGFTLINLAGPNNFRGSEYSNFKDNFKPLKSLPTMTDIRWYTEIVM